MVIPKNYQRGMDYLNEKYPFFTVVVHNLGRPVVNNKIPTLQVQRNKDDKQFELVINEEFLSGLSDAEVAATLIHESFHITLSHLTEAFTLVKEDDRAGQKKMVLAQECIVNDNVVNEGFQLPDLRKPDPLTGELKGGLFYGPDVVGMCVAYYTTREVMDMIDDDNEQFQQMGGGEDGNEHYVIMSEQDLQDLQDAISKGVRHAVYEGKIDPADIESEDLKNILKINGYGKKAGSTMSKTEKMFQKMGLSINWFKYLRRLDPSAFRDGGSMGDLASSWHSLRRKTAYLHRDGIRLPVYKPRYTPNNVGLLKPQIVLALDFSGSIPAETAQIMGNLARAIPDSIDVHCCTFSTEYVPFNHKIDGNQPTASGGTDFSAIQEFVNSLNLKVQPNVVVITDGYASFTRAKPSQAVLDSKWNWLLIDQENKVDVSNIKESTVEYLQDYLLGNKGI